jgi:ribosomal-protein-alanine N-acetyltransferase
MAIENMTGAMNVEDFERLIDRREGAEPETRQPVVTDWRQGLPVLRGDQVVLREIRPSDAEPLLALVSAAEVSRFISAPPETAGQFERFIASTTRQRALGTHVCYVVTLKGLDTPVGLFQVREIEGGFASAEWGYALGSPFWGTGIFREAAELVLDFVFNMLGVHRLAEDPGPPEG